MSRREICDNVLLALCFGMVFLWVMVLANCLGLLG